MFSPSDWRVPLAPGKILDKRSFVQDGLNLFSPSNLPRTPPTRKKREEDGKNTGTRKKPRENTPKERRGKIAKKDADRQRPDQTKPTQTREGTGETPGPDWGKVWCLLTPCFEYGQIPLDCRQFSTLAGLRLTGRV